HTSGGGVQIFNIGTIFMLLLNPLPTRQGSRNACKPTGYSPDHTLHENAHSLTTLPLQKIVKILFNLLALANVSIWDCQCHSLGLLQVGAADWLAFGT
ncbi:hypothetical protein HYPSUDRAFT_148484, partial [Hypholoma sublateritium FD-334 SS-4]